MNLKSFFFLSLLIVLFSVLSIMPAFAQFIQQGSKLVGTGTVGTSSQGKSVALSTDGNTAIIGGYNDNSALGAVWIYTRNGVQWTQQGSKIVGTGSTGSARQGVAVSLSSDGNTAIVGGYTDGSSVGAAWIFTRNSAVWSQQGNKLVGTGTVGNAQHGVSVALSADGNTAIIGGDNDNSSIGAAWVYTRTGGVWSQQGNKLVGTGSLGGAHQGACVALSADGNTAVVGAPFDSSGVGAVWIYTRTGGVWTQQGEKLVGTGFSGGSAQGVSAALSADGNTVIVGGHYDNNFLGAVWVYTRSNGVWTQQGSKLIGSGTIAPSWFGRCVSLSDDGGTAVVGGPFDNSNLGAVWVFKRNGGMWTQQGNKLVGSGATGSALQGETVWISGDKSTLLVGGEEDNGYLGAAWVFNYISSSPSIISISDIPADQGGQVRIKWKNSILDNSGSQQLVTSYSIWRKSSSGASGTINKGILPDAISMDSSLLGYDYVASVPAVQLPQYQTVVPTLEDSASTGTHRFNFLVVAHTSDQTQYYVSLPDSGYSVDNLAPIPPAGIIAAVQAGPQVQLTWSSPADPDVGHYDIYRSTISGFIPSPAFKIGIISSTSYTDGSPSPGHIYYYRIVAVDIHGNESQPSNEASAPVTITQSFSLRNSWNMISIPFTLNDYTKTHLYPSAVSSAFSFEGSYIPYGTLKNGVAYWLKFNGDQNVPLSGILRSQDTINTIFGWNMIGSIGAAVPVSTISSIPGGLATSKFYGYAGSYYDADTIQPGNGYWVKVSQAGKLILSASSIASPSSHIHILTSSDTPPKPPEEDFTAIELPVDFALQQNYPNPFNPATVIKYALPTEEHVKLLIYNMVGQEISILVNEVQSAGYKSASFKANNLPSGIYTYRLTAGTFTDVKKMMLVK